MGMLLRSDMGRYYKPHVRTFLVHLVVISMQGNGCRLVPGIRIVVRKLADEAVEGAQRKELFLSSKLTQHFLHLILQSTL